MAASTPIPISRRLRLLRGHNTRTGFDFQSWSSSSCSTSGCFGTSMDTIAYVVRTTSYFATSIGSLVLNRNILKQRVDSVVTFPNPCYKVPVSKIH
ncbi:hypothetical protein LXL04_016344 [Taraxacum kok-saghyz]